MKIHYNVTAITQLTEFYIRTYFSKYATNFWTTTEGKQCRAVSGMTLNYRGRDWEIDKEKRGMHMQLQFGLENMYTCLSNHIYHILTLYSLKSTT